MSRFYNIVLTKAGADPGAAPVRQYTSSKTGQPTGDWIPGALQVEFDLPISSYATPVQQELIRIHGVPLIDISQASDFVGLNCQIYGGMGKGLPLAKPSQAGLLCQGMILQAFANWVGTNMTLNLVVVPADGEPGPPVNLVLIWAKGQPLGEAVATALQVAFPQYDPPINSSSDKLVKDSEEVGFYPNVRAMQDAVLGFSQAILPAPYDGLQIIFRNNQWVIYDSTATSVMPGGSTRDSPNAIDFLDLIGQPTWFDAGRIQFNCPMRADLAIGDFIRLPPGPVTTMSGSQPQARSKTAFAGVFQITFVRHLGDYRQADAASWITTCNAAVQDPGAFVAPPS